MIIKNLRHKVLNSAYSVNYVFDGMPKSEENKWVIFQNISSGFNRKDIIAEFDETAQLLRLSPTREKTIRFHEILAFSDKNSKDLTREKLQVIAHEYLRLRDPKCEARAICVPHDGSTPHIHLLITSNGIDSTKSGDLMLTNARYYEIRREIERFSLNRFPELHHSTVFLSEKEIQALLPEKYLAERRLQEIEKPKKRNTAKEQVSQIIKTILEKSHTLDKFVERINNTSDFQTYYRRGKLTGVIHEGKKRYRFSNLGINLLEENFSVLSRMNELEALKEKNQYNSLER